MLALSRHGDLPFVHEDPWRPRLPDPAFTVEEFLSFADPFEGAAERLRSHGEDWRRAVDSLRPITQSLWLAMGDDLRRRFLQDWRRAWEVRRSRVPPDTMTDLERWRADGSLEVHAGPVSGVSSAGVGLRIEAATALLADIVLLATGPEESPAVNPFLAAAIEDGLLRPGPLGLGLDVDPVTGRARDAAGLERRLVFAIGPLRKGVLWETTAMPEIRVQAAEVASAVLAATS